MASQTICFRGSDADGEVEVRYREGVFEGAPEVSLGFGGSTREALRDAEHQLSDALLTLRHMREAEMKGDDPRLV